MKPPALSSQVQSTKTRLAYISSLLVLIFFSPSILSQDADAPSSTTNTPSAELPPSIQWPVLPQALAEKNQANSTEWIQVNDIRIPVLSFWAKGRKSRGTVIIVSGQGENPGHPRIIHPLSVQMSQLGWQVLVPLLPKPDFPEEIENKTSESTAESPEQANDTANAQSVEPIKSSTYFENSQAYQDFFNQIISSTIQLNTNTTPGLMVIGNQNAAYWLLEIAKSNTNLTQLVFISPQVPKSIIQDVEQKFEGQNLPIYSLIENERDSNSFIRAFEQKKWRSRFIRLNRGLVIEDQIHLENTFIAKTLSGWVASQNDTKK